MPLTLRPVARSKFDRVSHFQVEPDQIRYPGTVAQAFEENENGVDFHAVLEADRAVGFFQIDQLYHETLSLVRADDLGLGAFMIDRVAQGRGYAPAAVAALMTYLTARHPDRRAVMQ
ncbi:GNAT family N-acetyltransferase [Leisingera sp.]|uniref:GNAT family N-acetyltransferase n=1 Tax=Leisingera sp. TaxID=1879318 RepID=UPI002B271431|nr:GNAT family N-acetyltransferase [Leisingera sp.]